MKRISLPIVALFATIALGACAGTADNQAAASPSPPASTAAPTATPDHDDAALSVELLSANTIPGQSSETTSVSVKLRYRITVNTPIQSAFGHATFPGMVRCAGGGVPVELGAYPNGAQVDREDVQICSVEDAKSLASDTQYGSHSLSWEPAKVTYP